MVLRVYPTLKWSLFFVKQCLLHVAPATDHIAEPSREKGSTSRAGERSSRKRRRIRNQNVVCIQGGLEAFGGTTGPLEDFAGLASIPRRERPRGSGFPVGGEEAACHEHESYDAQNKPTSRGQRCSIPMQSRPQPPAEAVHVNGWKHPTARSRDDGHDNLAAGVAG